MGFDFFKYVFPPLARQHYLNAISLSSWLYLFEECNPRTVAVAVILTIHAVKNGIQVYQEFSWNNEDEIEPEPPSSFSFSVKSPRPR